MSDTTANTKNSRTQRANNWRHSPTPEVKTVHAAGLAMPQHSRQAQMQAAAGPAGPSKAEAAMENRRREMISDIVAGRKPQLDHVNDPDHFAFGVSKQDGVVPGVIRGAK